MPIIRGSEFFKCLNFSKLRGLQAQILGQLVIADIQQSLLRREQIPERKRLPYHFYIDEFSLFTTSEQSFIDLFERARKYRCGVTLAHQVTADIPSKLFSVIVGNVATVIALQLSADDAPFFAREMQLHTIRNDETMGALSPTVIQNLPLGHAIVKVPTWNYGIPVRIPLIDDPDPSETARIAGMRKARSKQQYGIAYSPSEEMDEDVYADTEEEVVPTPVSEKPRRTKKGDKPNTVTPPETGTSEEADEVFKIQFD